MDKTTMALRWLISMIPPVSLRCERLDTLQWTNRCWRQVGLLKGRKHCVAFKYEIKKTHLFVILLCLTQIRKLSVGQDRYCEPFACKTTTATVCWLKTCFQKGGQVLQDGKKCNSRTAKYFFPPNYSEMHYTCFNWRWVVPIYLWPCTLGLQSMEMPNNQGNVYCVYTL